jgi:hypothetical protein
VALVHLPCDKKRGGELLNMAMRVTEALIPWASGMLHHPVSLVLLCGKIFKASELNKCN